MCGGGPFNLLPGQWTDDTSPVALCLAESLIRCGGKHTHSSFQHNSCGSCRARAGGATLDSWKVRNIGPVIHVIALNHPVKQQVIIQSSRWVALEFGALFGSL